jgi:hypothetical protein
MSSDPTEKFDNLINELMQDPDIVWGYEDIGKLIGLDNRQIYYLVSKNKLACVRKFGGRPFVSRRELFRELLSGK